MAARMNLRALLSTRDLPAVDRVSVNAVAELLAETATGQLNITEFPTTTRLPDVEILREFH